MSKKIIYLFIYFYRRSNKFTFRNFKNKYGKIQWKSMTGSDLQAVVFVMLQESLPLMKKVKLKVSVGCFSYIY